MVAHEYAHAATAFRQGDDTASSLGRLTLNPLKHIDPIMTVLVPIGLWVASHGTWTFGAAKPVPVDPSKFREHPLGDIIVSLAGIVTNLGLFVACVLAYVLVGVVGGASPRVAEAVQGALWSGIAVNLLLAFFNLIPIPPLDGSRVLYQFLPPVARARYRQLFRFGLLPIVAISLLLPGVVDVLLWPAFRLMDVAGMLIHGFTIKGAA